MISLGRTNKNRIRFFLLISISLIFQSAALVSEHGESDPQRGQVLFGSDKYQYGDEMEIYLKGTLSDDVVYLYSPDGIKQVTYDPDLNKKVGNEKFTHNANYSGTWLVQLWKKSWIGGNLEFISYSTIEVVGTIPQGDGSVEMNNSGGEGNPSSINSNSTIRDRDTLFPDYDLHAFTPDGRHVGKNYTSGEYEIHIEGATTSGDMLWGVEWIFVPDNEVVRFIISNHDTEEYLKKYPEAANITANMSYNMTIYHEDGNSIRYDSTLANQRLAPGEEQDYRFDVQENEDGTFTIIVDYDPPVIFSMYPSNNSTVYQEYNISAEYKDEGTGININSIKLKVDDIDVTSDTNITESSLVYTPLHENGNHTFEIIVADKLGNTAFLNHSFIADIEQHDDDLIYPANNLSAAQTNTSPPNRTTSIPGFSALIMVVALVSLFLIKMR